MAATLIPDSDELRLCSRSGRLHRGSEVFDPWQLRWAAAVAPAESEPVTATEAVQRLSASGLLRGVPIAIIGPKEANAAQLATAEALGRRLTETGFKLICGGRIGVMEAASRGCRAAGGSMIGILPDDEWYDANDHVAIPIATGLGPARNAIIARAAIALVAIGGGHGTLTEMAFGMHFDRLVLALQGAPEVPGAIVCEDVEEARVRIARRLLSLDRPRAAP